MSSIVTPPHSSWTHRLTRVLVRPLVGTRIRPNDLTTARLVTGLAACAAFTVGDPDWNVWGGILWLVSCLLDRADGELARISGTTSAWGHRYDYYCDVTANSLFFVAIGFGLRNGDLNNWAVALGLFAGLSVAAASVWSERLERASGGNDKAYVGIAGFDFDDVLYLFAPVAWFGLLPFLLVGAVVGAPIIAALTWVRLIRRCERRVR